MSRFIWIDSKELYDEHFPMIKGFKGKEFSGYSDTDEGLIYDTVDKVTILNFGSYEEYYPTCGEKPNDKYLSIIMSALNSPKAESVK